MSTICASSGDINTSNSSSMSVDVSNIDYSGSNSIIIPSMYENMSSHSTNPLLSTTKGPNHFMIYVTYNNTSSTTHGHSGEYKFVDWDNAEKLLDVIIACQAEACSPSTDSSSNSNGAPLNQDMKPENIDFSIVSKRLGSIHGITATASQCRRVWHFLAYGTVGCSEEALEDKSDEDDYIYQPAAAHKKAINSNIASYIQFNKAVSDSSINSSIEGSTAVCNSSSDISTSSSISSQLTDQLYNIAASSSEAVYPPPLLYSIKRGKHPSRKIKFLVPEQVYTGTDCMQMLIFNHESTFVLGKHAKTIIDRHPLICKKIAEQNPFYTKPYQKKAPYSNMNMNMNMNGSASSAFGSAVVRSDTAEPKKRSKAVNKQETVGSTLGDSAGGTATEGPSSQDSSSFIDTAQTNHLKITLERVVNTIDYYQKLKRALEEVDFNNNISNSNSNSNSNVSSSNVNSSNDNNESNHNSGNPSQERIIKFFQFELKLSGPSDRDGQLSLVNQKINSMRTVYEKIKLAFETNLLVHYIDATINPSLKRKQSSTDTTGGVPSLSNPAKSPRKAQTSENTLASTSNAVTEAVAKSGAFNPVIFRTQLYNMITKYPFSNWKHRQEYKPLLSFVSDATLKDAYLQFEMTFKPLLSRWITDYITANPKSSVKILFREGQKRLDRFKLKKEKDCFFAINDWIACRLVISDPLEFSIIKQYLLQSINSLSAAYGDERACCVGERRIPCTYDKDGVPSDLIDCFHFYIPTVGYIAECQILHPFADYAFKAYSLNRDCNYFIGDESSIFAIMRGIILRDAKNRVINKSDNESNISKSPVFETFTTEYSRLRGVDLVVAEQELLHLKDIINQF